MINEEMVQPAADGLTTFVMKIFSSVMLLVNKLSTWPRLPPPSSSSSSTSSSDIEHENEYNLSWSSAAEPNNNNPCQTLLLLQRETTYYSNNQSRSFYSRRRDSSVAFFNVNIFNFCHEAFSSNLIFAPLIPILLSFLQIRSSAINPSPFKLHPVIFMASVVCAVAYYFTVAAKFMFRGFASGFEVIVSASGSLAVALLICLILQLPWWSVFIIMLLLGGFLKLLNKIHKRNGEIRRGSQLRTRQPLLPLHSVALDQ